MRWFKPGHATCKDCGIHYDPVVGLEARWGDFCPMHRKPVMERDLRKDAVISWASGNWERLEAMYLEEVKETRDRHQSVFQKSMDAMVRQQQAQHAYYGFGGLMG